MKRIAIFFPSDVKFLRMVREAAARALDLFPRFREVKDDIILALNEACTNAIRHAHNFDPSKEIEIELKIEEDKIEIIVKDEGKGFQIDQILQEIPELSESGYGLYLIRKLMDEVHYLRGGGKGKNELKMIKRAEYEREANSHRG